MKLVVARNLTRLLFMVMVSCLGACSFLSGQFAADEGGVVTDGNAVMALFAQAREAENQGDIKQAGEFYEQMLEEGAKSSHTLNYYAVYLRKQFDIDAAESVYHRAIRYSPNDARSHYNLAILYELYRGDFASAKKHFEIYLANTPEPDKKVSAWIRDLERRVATSSESKS